MSFPLEKGDSFPLQEKDETISGQDQVRRAQLKMQFHGIRKGDDETIEVYVKQLKSTADSLAAIDSPIPDPDLVLQLLAGLPSQYLPFQKTISSQFPLPAFSEACSMLYMYETLLKEQTNPNSNNSSEERKEKFEKMLAIFNTVTSVASTAWDLWNVFGTSAAKTVNPGNKKYTKKPGRGNYHKRGASNTNFRNSARK
uniref:Uncharacterized protein n=1 Tax=Nicotiana tabacum TaxID=4097 RepID=A0A1S4DBK4_TOBAC|nr:PREDICTED: uncharacterized protein LOC107827996 [Nicotiana tabacum]